MEPIAFKSVLACTPRNLPLSYFWPEGLIRGGGHVGFATLQTIAFLGYLIYVLRFFAAMAPMIQRAIRDEAAGGGGL